jgi:hypothetical protein
MDYDSDSEVDNDSDSGDSNSSDGEDEASDLTRWYTRDTPVTRYLKSFHVHIILCRNHIK